MTLIDFYENMESEIIDRKEFKLIGMDYYGTLKSAGREGENAVADLWQRFTDFCEAKWELIDEYVANPKLSYEMHIWNEEEYQDTGNFHAFVGVEVNDVEYLPLELVIKKIPGGKFGKFTFRGGEIGDWERMIYDQWMPDSDYGVETFEGYSLDIQCYHEEEFKGVDRLEDSKMEVYVPLVEYKEESDE